MLFLIFLSDFDFTWLASVYSHVQSKWPTFNIWSILLKSRWISTSFPSTKAKLLEQSQRLCICPAWKLPQGVTGFWYDPIRKEFLRPLGFLGEKSSKKSYAIEHVQSVESSNCWDLDDFQNYVEYPEVLSEMLYLAIIS